MADPTGVTVRRRTLTTENLKRESIARRAGKDELYGSNLVLPDRKSFFQPDILECHRIVPQDFGDCGKSKLYHGGAGQDRHASNDVICDVRNSCGVYLELPEMRVGM